VGVLKELLKQPGTWNLIANTLQRVDFERALAALTRAKEKLLPTT
jgi:hypothetical protein